MSKLLGYVSAVALVVALSPALVTPAIAATFSQAFALTGSTPGSGVLTLTNGPPNIPMGTSGSCTYGTCTWIQAGITNEPVTQAFLDMVPMSQLYTGTYTICEGAGCTPSTTSTTNFNLTRGDWVNTAESPNRTYSVAHITTNGALACGDYPLTIGASGVTQPIIVHAAGTACSPYNGMTVVADTGGTISNIQSLVSGQNNLVVLMQAKTYDLSNNHLAVYANQMLLGAGIDTINATGSTIIDGGNSDDGHDAVAYYGAIVGVGGPELGDTGGGLANLYFQNMGSPFVRTGTSVCQDDKCQSIINSTDGWAVRNNYLVGGSMVGISVQANNSAFVVNNRVMRMGSTGIPGASGFTGSGSSATPVNVIGNEVAAANQNHGDTCDNTSGGLGKWVPISGNFTGQSRVILSNNYVHDGLGAGFWSDFNNSEIYFIVTNNTIVRQGIAGISFEIGQGGVEVADHNFLRNDGNGYAETAHYCGNFSNEQWYPDAGISGSGTNNYDIHDNNVVAEIGPSSPGGQYSNDTIVSGHDNSGRTDDNTNNFVHNNTVTFRGANIGSVFGPQDCCGVDSSFTYAGSYMDNDHFHFTGGDQSTASYFYWFALSGGNQSTTLAGIQASPYLQETHATVDTADTSAAGCTHVACTSAGVGTDGVPQ